MSHGNTVRRGSGGLLLNQEIMPCSGLACCLLVVLTYFGQDGSGSLMGEGQLIEKMAKGREMAQKSNETIQKVSGGVISQIWVSVSRNLIQQVHLVFKE